MAISEKFLGLWVSLTMHGRLQAKAARDGCSVGAAVRDLIERGLDAERSVGR
jgi:hypothetical protein